jgi:hypothetical protein
VDEGVERDLEAMMRRRKQVEARLNRALNELLGSGTGSEAALVAIDEMEQVLRSIASFVATLP